MNILKKNVIRKLPARMWHAVADTHKVKSWLAMQVEGVWNELKFLSQLPPINFLNQKKCVWAQGAGESCENPLTCYRNKKPHGLWEERYSNGQISVGIYVNGKRHGLWKTLYASGRREYEIWKYGWKRILDQVNPNSQKSHDASINQAKQPAADESKVKISVEGWSLRNAIMQNRTDIAMQLIEDGVDINLTRSNGDTLLHCVARRNNYKIARLLIKHGADVNATNRSTYTSLHIAVMYGNYGVASVLIQKKADVNKTDKNGETALHYAASYSSIKFAKRLIAGGADANVKDKYGRLPYDYVRVERVSAWLGALTK